MEFVAKRSNQNYTSKILKPGTHYARIVDIRIDVPSYNKDAMSLVFILEGPELPDFTGAAKNKLNPSEGNYKGQIAYVKSGKYAFTDYVYAGKEIKRDAQIHRFMLNLADKLGVLDKMEADGVRADTIEEFIFNTSKYLVDEDLYAYFTIGGKEDKNEHGTNYRMYFPKAEKVGTKYLQPFFKDKPGLRDEHLKDNMVMFDEAKHIERDAVVEVSDMNVEEGIVIATTGTTTGSIYSGGSGTITLGGRPTSFTL